MLLKLHVYIFLIFCMYYLRFWVTACGSMSLAAPPRLVRSGHPVQPRVSTGWLMAALKHLIPAPIQASYDTYLGCRGKNSRISYLLFIFRYSGHWHCGMFIRNGKLQNDAIPTIYFVLFALYFFIHSSWREVYFMLLWELQILKLNMYQVNISFWSAFSVH